MHLDFFLLVLRVGRKSVSTMPSIGTRSDQCRYNQFSVVCFVAEEYAAGLQWERFFPEGAHQPVCWGDRIFGAD